MSRQPPHIVLFFDISLFVERLIVSGVLRYANSFAHWFVTLASSHEPISLPKNCDGILVCSPTLEVLEKLKTFNLPLVVINNARSLGVDEHSLSGLAEVLTESKTFGILAAEFFLSREPRTFVYVGSVDTRIWDEERKNAFVARMRQSRVEPLVYPAPAAPETSAEDSEDLKNWLLTIPRPMAIFATNDARAREVLTACQMADITVPYEAEILGVDNDEWICEAARPRLSSISFNSEEGGIEAAKILEALIRKRAEASLPLPPLTRTISPVAIIERESTNDRKVPDPIVSRALAYIQLNRGLNIRIQDVADAVGYSPGWVESRFRQTLDISINDEIARIRMDTILSLIRTSSLSFQEIAQQCGFTNASTLCRLIKKETGKTMTELRNCPTLR